MPQPELRIFRGSPALLGIPICRDAAGWITDRSRRMNMFYIIGVIVVVLVIAGFFGLR